jgi:hypothetical protein
MSKELEALFRLLEEKEIMPDEYYLGDGYKNDLKLIIEALKRLKKYDMWFKKLKENNVFVIQLYEGELGLVDLSDPNEIPDEWLDEGEEDE